MMDKQQIIKELAKAIYGVLKTPYKDATSLGEAAYTIIEPLLQNEQPVSDDALAGKVARAIYMHMNHTEPKTQDWSGSYGSYINLAKAAIAAMPGMQNIWQPIESIPLDIECLIYGTANTMLYPSNQILIGYHNDRGSFWAVTGQTISHATHWMPLPTSPVKLLPTGRNHADTQ